jgi:hypothetical protein
VIAGCRMLALGPGARGCLKQSRGRASSRLSTIQELAAVLGNSDYKHQTPYGPHRVMRESQALEESEADLSPRLRGNCLRNRQISPHRGDCTVPGAGQGREHPRRGHLRSLGVKLPVERLEEFAEEAIVL